MNPPALDPQLASAYLQLVEDEPRSLYSAADRARVALHLEDGAAGAALVAALAPHTVVDIGSGGGVPGLVIAAQLPQAQVTMVEASAWKCAFLAHAAATLALESRVEVCCERVEHAPGILGREAFDVACARACAAPTIVAEYATPLTRVGGHLMLWSTQAHAADTAVSAWPRLGLGEPSVLAAPSELRADGVIICWPKIAPCDPALPRRDGRARQRPLRPPAAP